MSVERDDLGFEKPNHPTVAAIVKRRMEDRMDREYVRTTIESPGWSIFYARAIKPILDEWRRDLLTRVDIPEEQRRGLVLARQTLLEGLLAMYERTEAHIPEWFEQELREI